MTNLIETAVERALTRTTLSVDSKILWSATPCSSTWHKIKKFASNTRDVDTAGRSFTLLSLAYFFVPSSREVFKNERQTDFDVSYYFLRFSRTMSRMSRDKIE